jgi:Right handed beta helix region
MKLRVLAGCSYIALSVGLALVFPFHTAQAQRTIQVPADAPTVQKGIDIASTGDTVNIAPGVYFEAIDFHGKSITVQGSAAGVVLDDGQTGPVVTFNSGETRSAILQNVTIRNGSAYFYPSAGGIFISGASPTIQNSTIQGNQKCGIAVFNGAPAILNNEITNTILDVYVEGCAPTAVTGSLYGGGILLYGTSNDGLQTQIIGNTIENNQVMFGSAGINVLSAGLPLIKNNIIRNNFTNDEGAGILVIGDTAPSIVQNLIYSNTINPTLGNPASWGVGAGLNVAVADGQFSSVPVLIVNNTIAGNELLLVPGARSQGSQFFAFVHMERIHLINNLIIGSTAQSAVDCAQSYPDQPVQPPTFDHNDVYNMNNGTNKPVYSVACPDQTGISGNISVDPLFASGAGDPRPFQLLLSSPAVDAGSNQAAALPTLDILGQSRIQNAKGLSNAFVDMGVYEYAGTPAIPPPPADFILTVNPSSITIAQGQSGEVSVIVTPTAANLGSVLLTCSGLPANASCTFSPSVMSFTTAASQPSTLTIRAGTAQSSLSRAPSPNASFSMVLVGLFLIPTLLAGKRGSSNKGLPWMVCIGAISAISLCAGLSGCGPDRFILIGAPRTYRLAVQAYAVNSSVSKQTFATLVVTQ